MKCACQAVSLNPGVVDEVHRADGSRHAVLDCLSAGGYVFRERAKRATREQAAEVIDLLREVSAKMDKLITAVRQS